jgi:glycosyltransferase involved in cell wall biosynthesis
VGTYPPRACGIATFTRDLRYALRELWSGELPVIALDRGSGSDPERYPTEVALRVCPPGIPGTLLRDVMAGHRVGVLALQHEFGIYGGPTGRDVLDLIAASGVPAITTLHTLPLEPTTEQARILGSLAASSARVVVMSERGRRLAVEGYGFDPAAMRVIPHGVPDMPFVETSHAKRSFGLPDGPVILSYGLLSPNKALGNAIAAMPEVLRGSPDAQLIIAGATHPEVRRQRGEAYRDSLIEQARRLGVAERVRFIGRYLTPDELRDLLLAADVFVAPYGDSAQLTSGTLAAAVASGRAVVATPFEHARELLADDRGVLVPFDDPAALGEAVVSLLSDETRRAAVRRRAWDHGRTMVWPSVAGAYGQLVTEVLEASPTALWR